MILKQSEYCQGWRACQICYHRANVIYIVNKVIVQILTNGCDEMSSMLMLTQEK